MLWLLWTSFQSKLLLSASSQHQKRVWTWQDSLALYANKFSSWWLNRGHPQLMYLCFSSSGFPTVGEALPSGRWGREGMREPPDIEYDGTEWVWVGLTSVVALFWDAGTFCLDDSHSKNMLWAPFCWSVSNPKQKQKHIPSRGELGWSSGTAASWSCFQRRQGGKQRWMINSRLGIHNKVSNFTSCLHQHTVW